MTGHGIETQEHDDGGPPADQPLTGGPYTEGYDAGMADRVAGRVATHPSWRPSAYRRGYRDGWRDQQQIDEAGS